jgi:hypothetical protein
MHISINSFIKLLKKILMVSYNLIPYTCIPYIPKKSSEEYFQKTSPKKILRDLYVLFRMRDDLVCAGSIRKKLFEKAA